MRILTVRNVNNALPRGLRLLANEGVTEDSRNGIVLAMQEPVTTTYLNPRERVLFSALRDANPFFHYVESMWMLMGMNDVATPAAYARQMEYYTDDGSTLNGAYGYRWRRYFGYDQLAVIADILRKDPTSRRCVLTMWSGANDLKDQTSKDLPCNTQVYFRVVNKRLDMLVTCRSNDIVWGAYGANAVHMSLLQEYMACLLDLPVGVYEQMSFNYHLYPERSDVKRLIDRNDGDWLVHHHTPDNRYALPNMRPAPMLFAHHEHGEFLEACSSVLLNGPEHDSGWNHWTVDNVLRPLMRAHARYKAGEREAALSHCSTIQADDWRVACYEWIVRREAAKATA